MGKFEGQSYTPSFTEYLFKYRKKGVHWSAIPDLADASSTHRAIVVKILKDNNLVSVNEHGRIIHAAFKEKPKADIIEEDAVLSDFFSRHRF